MKRAADDYGFIRDRLRDLQSAPSAENELDVETRMIEAFDQTVGLLEPSSECEFDPDHLYHERGGPSCAPAQTIVWRFDDADHYAYCNDFPGSPEIRHSMDGFEVWTPRGEWLGYFANLETALKAGLRLNRAAERAEARMFCNLVLGDAEWQ
jgi:hypothetical protein